MRIYLDMCCYNRPYKEKDALHLASAIYACCTYFISTDIRLLKYKTDRIKLVTPVEFIMEAEGEQ
jgi:predicted nucleic acid-binding protein